MIHIRYFARLREQLGTAEENLKLPAGIRTLGELQELLKKRGSPWREALSTPALLMAVNHAMAGPEALVADGDEVAFFPPVTGG